MHWMAEQRMRSYEMTEIGHAGSTRCLDEAFEIAMDECDAVFLSVDIDVCDPGHAPGTGTPEPGGLSSRQLLDAVRRICLELPVAGIDVVEVSPPYDHAEITAYLANRVCLEALSGLAARTEGPFARPRRAAAGRPVMATLFRNGSLFDGHRHRGPGAVVVEDGRIVEVGAEADLETAPGRTSRSSTWPADFSPRGSWTPTCHAGPGRARTDPVRPVRGQGREGYLAAVASYAAEHPEVPWVLGGGWAMPAFPGGTPTAADLDGSWPTGRSTCPTGTTTGPGSTAGRSSWPASMPRTPDPPHGRIERDADGHPSGTLHEGAMHAGRPPCAGRRSGRLLPRPARGAAATSTRWASPPGRTRSSATTPAWHDPGPTYLEAIPQRRPARPTSSARCGGSGTSASSRWPTSSSRRERYSRRSVPRDERQDHAGRRGRELHRRA